jgi:predicted RND superfamily exporter protein
MIFMVIRAGAAAAVSLPCCKGGWRGLAAKEVGVARRARGLAVFISYFVATAVGFFVVSSPHSWFVAIFGTFAVGGVAGVAFVTISLGARLLRVIKGRS